MTNTITNRQMFFILLLTLSSYSVVHISNTMVQTAGTGSWISILITSIIFALSAVVIVSLNNRFEGKMLFDYAGDIVGKPIGYIISVFYACYFIYITSFLNLQMGKLLKMDFLPKTPVWVFIAIGTPVFCFVAYKGITTIARMFEIFGVLYIVTATTVHILMATQGQVDRILPLFNPDDIVKYAEGIKTALFAFYGFEILLMIPFTKRNKEKGARTAFLSIIAIGIFYILIVETCIMKIGINDIVNYKDSLIVAIRDMSLPFLDFFERFDILFLTVGFWGFYMGIIITITAVVEYACKIFKKAKRSTIVIIVGAIVLIYSLIASTITGYEEIVVEASTYIGLVASIGIPLILLIIAKVKKHGT